MGEYKNADRGLELLSNPRKKRLKTLEVVMIKKGKYDCIIEDNVLTLKRNGKDFLSLPASASVNKVFSRFTRQTTDENTIRFSSDFETMTFDLYDDCIIVRYEKTFEEKTPIFQARIFTDGVRTVDLKGIDRAFCPQPRNNGGKNMDYYHRLPDISQNGYFSPCLLSFSIGSPYGWVSFGLLDIPDSKTCKMDEDHSVLVESCGGNKVIPQGGVYRMPGILITFPEDEWDAVTVFRNKLFEFGLYKPQKRKFTELPDWWKNPFVCTYGDQMLERKVGQFIDEKWVLEQVRIAEEEWGMKNINLIIDDSWQPPHAFEPIADKNRFPDFRGLIDSLHDRGHRVILWQTPLFDKITNGFTTRTQRLGVLTDYEYKSPYFKSFPGCYAIDYTSNNARQFIREVVRVLFGDEEGQYNADGIKLDFLGLLRDPAVTRSYENPEKGIGMRELLLFYEMFYEEAKKVKPDVLINATVGDPRFEHVIDFNRLHDTHCGVIEKEMRARIASLGCPDLPIDSDGALMFTRWIKAHYISAALYAVPSIYYLKQFHDFAKYPNRSYIYGNPDHRNEFSIEQKRQLGNLLQMTKFRPNGRVYMDSFGNWVLKDGDKINGMTIKGETVIYYPTEENDTGYIFTWQDEVIILPLHGRKISQIDPKPKKDYFLADYARDRAIMYLEPGVVHTFKNTDDKKSINRIFSTKASQPAEEEPNYMNW
jgi:hypothetical protein